MHNYQNREKETTIRALHSLSFLLYLLSSLSSGSISFIVLAIYLSEQPSFLLVLTNTCVLTLLYYDISHHYGGNTIENITFGQHIFRKDESTTPCAKLSAGLAGCLCVDVE
jgi:hypothetical protein